MKGTQGWREPAGWAREMWRKGEGEISDVLEFVVVGEKLSFTGSVTEEN